MKGARMPAEACVAPAPTVRASNIRTLAPRRASSRATTQPMIPPPMTMTSCRAFRGSYFRLGARGSGLGARDSGLGTRGSGLGTRDSGLGARGSGLGTRGSGLGTRGSVSKTYLINPPSREPARYA
jgi:hypothetical protein